MTEAPNKARTEDESARARPPGTAVGREELVVAFPVSCVVPVPSSDEFLGRGWLAKHANIDDPKASGEHCRITRRGGVFVEDHNARNGTWVDGVRIKPGERIPLEDGSVLRVGRTLLVYRRNLIGSPAPSPSLGQLVGPYGLRTVEKQLNGIVTRTPMNVLVEGETGTGKELMGREIATRCGRVHRYERLNMTAIPSELFEGTLFGYVSGAYSGARAGGSRGVLVEHQGGAVFFDEIGDLPLDLQPKLLRVLENREVWPVGASRSQHVDVVIIAATNRPLRQAVKEGRFRLDLLERLEQSKVNLPPLRERAEDIFAIAQAWSAAKGTPLDVGEVEVEAVEHLLLEEWPGNVRQLFGTLDRVAIESRPGVLHAWAVESVLGVPPPSRGPMTRERAQEILQRHGGNESKAAAAAGMSRPRFRRLLGK